MKVDTNGIALIRTLSKTTSFTLPTPYFWVDLRVSLYVSRFFFVNAIQYSVAGPWLHVKLHFSAACPLLLDDVRQVLDPGQQRFVLLAHHVLATCNDLVC